MREDVQGGVEDRAIRSRVSRTLVGASTAAVAGSPKACTTLGWGRRSGGSSAWVCMLFCHECLEAGTTISDRNKRTRCGIWPHNGQSSSELILGHLSFWLRVAVMVQFGHRDWGLQI